MTVIVGRKPYPWPCHRCGNHDIQSTPTNCDNDPQEVSVLCNTCNAEWLTSGIPFFVDRDKGVCREINKEEFARLVDHGSLTATANVEFST